MNAGSCKRISLLFVVVALAMAAAAQDTQRVETFGGYSLSHDSSFLLGSSNFSGWDTSTTVFLNRWLGFTSDFSGHYGAGTFPFFVTPEGPQGKYKLNVNSYTYLFGPHITYRHSRYAPFVQTLFGIQNPHQNFRVLETCPGGECPGEPVGKTNSTSYAKFAMSVGGGLDIAVGHGISLRPVQAEYLLLRELNYGRITPIGFNNNTFRYSTGVTFHFGHHLGTGK
ncbi:MAG: hypothetical protein ABSD98_10475 [Candidatus Korobacteraceae bacterium]|jgi:hypothetical protein